MKKMINICINEETMKMLDKDKELTGKSKCKILEEAYLISKGFKIVKMAETVEKI